MSEHNYKCEEAFDELLEETQYNIKFVIDPCYNDEIQNDLFKIVEGNEI